jgi:hypothetical protein
MKSWLFILFIFLSCNTPKVYSAFTSADLEYSNVIREKLSNKFGRRIELLLSTQDSILHLPVIENLAISCNKHLLKNIKYSSSIYTPYDSSIEAQNSINVLVNYYENQKSAEEAYTLLKKLFNDRPKLEEKDYGCFYLLSIVDFKDYFVAGNHLIFVENSINEKTTYNYLMEILK